MNGPRLQDVLDLSAATRFLSGRLSEPPGPLKAGAELSDTVSVLLIQRLDLCRIFMLKSHLHWRFPYKTWFS